MNHSLSIETKAAERYLLGELLPKERDAFEQHFFECPQCASDVCAGSALAHGVHSFFSEVPVARGRPIRQTTATAWRSWFVFPASVPAAAAFALLAFTAYQNAILLPGLHQVVAESARPRLLPSAVLVPASRSALPSVSVPASEPFFQLLLALPPTKSSGKYDCELLDDFGRGLWSIQVSVAIATEDINLLVPATRLATGTYEIVLRGTDKHDTDPFRFKLIRQ
jgi:hypothetical protein